METEKDVIEELTVAREKEETLRREVEEEKGLWLDKVAEQANGEATANTQVTRKKHELRLHVLESYWQQAKSDVQDLEAKLRKLQGLN